MRKVLLLLALCATVPSLWQPLRGDTPSKGVKASGNKKQDTALSQPQSQPSRGTKEAPFFVDTDGHAETPEETAKHKADDDHKSFVDAWTVGSAIAVALFTGALMMIGYCGVRAANRTLRSIQKQEKTMNDALVQATAATAAATDSAKIAKDTLLVSQRAYIGIAKLSLVPPDGWQTMERIEQLLSCCVEIVFANTGNTIARAFYFHMRTHIDLFDELSPGSVHEIVSRPTDCYPSANQGTKTLRIRDLFGEDRLLVGSEIANGHLRVDGVARYKDVFGNGYKVDYNSFFDPASNKLLLESTEGPDGE